MTKTTLTLVLAAAIGAGAPLSCGGGDELTGPGGCELAREKYVQACGPGQIKGDWETFFDRCADFYYNSSCGPAVRDFVQCSVDTDDLSCGQDNECAHFWGELSTSPCDEKLFGTASSCSCDGKECGDDGCGGSCGACTGGQTCSNGKCQGGCQPQCAGKECGSDGCGGSCGSCYNAMGGLDSSLCSNGTCQTCKPSCSGKVCGGDGCGGSCGSCSGGKTCSNGKCQGGCQPQCAGKECGSDGCGGLCGSCYDATGGIDNSLCVGGKCKEDVCVPSCKSTCDPKSVPSSTSDPNCPTIYCGEKSTDGCGGICYDKICSEPGASCDSIFECMGNCGEGDSNCKDNCFQQGSTSGKQLLVSLSECFSDNGGSACPDYECWITVMADHCLSEYKACFNYLLPCWKLYGCTGGVPAADWFEAAEACIGSGMPSDQLEFLDLMDCIYESCGNPPTQSCLDSSISNGGKCDSQYDACMN